MSAATTSRWLEALTTRTAWRWPTCCRQRLRPHLRQRRRRQLQRLQLPRTHLRLLRHRPLPRPQHQLGPPRHLRPRRRTTQRLSTPTSPRPWQVRTCPSTPKSSTPASIICGD